jgi:hypothetical protein
MVIPFDLVAEITCFFMRLEAISNAYRKIRSTPRRVNTDCCVANSKSVPANIRPPTDRFSPSLLPRTTMKSISPYTRFCNDAPQSDPGKSGVYCESVNKIVGRPYARSCLLQTKGRTGTFCWLRRSRCELPPGPRPVGCFSIRRSPDSPDPYDTDIGTSLAP